MNSEQPQWHKEGTQPHEIRNAERREIDALPAGTTAGAARALRALATGAVAFGALAGLRVTRQFWDFESA